MRALLNTIMTLLVVLVETVRKRVSYLNVKISLVRGIYAKYARRVATAVPGMWHHGRYTRCVIQVTAIGLRKVEYLTFRACRLQPITRRRYVEVRYSIPVITT